MSAEIKQDPWKDKLLASGSGTPKPIVANAIIALREAPIWFGALAFDLLACETWLVREPPWNAALAEWTPRPWSPQDDMRATFWLQNHGIAVTPATVAQAIETVAHDQEYNPLTDYLSSLEFDGQPRLDSWMSGYLGTAQNDYTAAVGRCSMIAAVARAYLPGCKSDAMPILEGIQGARKSTAVKTLFDPWFTDELADFGSKDAAMQLRGAWGVEVSELDAMSRGEISRVKAFTSRTTDRFRPPYGARVIESPRSCVFWGTTNAEGYLKDETGGRRFWPVKVGKINIEALGRDRDQLWAEARFLFDAGASWWITNPAVIREAEVISRTDTRATHGTVTLPHMFGTKPKSIWTASCAMSSVWNWVGERLRSTQGSPAFCAQWASIDTRRVLVTGANGCTAER